MKASFLIILPLLLFTSCYNNPEKSTPATIPVKTDTNPPVNNFVDLDSIEVRRQRLLDTNYTFLNKLLDSCVSLARRKGFETPFTATIDTTVFRFKNMHATISFGHLFSADRKHLLIKRFINEYNDYETSLYSDLFILDKNKLKKAAADTCDNGYREDNFEDVNHDGYEDYIVQSYSSAGCCPRNLEMGYLYNPQTGYLVSIDFFNRETDSISNFFFETSYGLGNYINLYKYKWSGLKKVLSEEIYVTPAKEGAQPASYTRILYPGKKKQILKKLPEEYARLRMAEYISSLEK